MLHRILGIVSLTAVIPAAVAADCARYQEMLAPVAVNFEGVPTTHMTGAWRVLTAPVRGAQQCTIAKKAAGTARAGLNCIWPFSKSSEADARRHMNDWAGALQGCRPQLRSVTSSKAMREREVDRILYKAADGDEGWAFILFQEPDESWIVSIVPTLQNVGADRKAEAPAAYRPVTQPPVHRPNFAPAPAPTATASAAPDCEPYRTFIAAAQTGFSAIPARESGGDRVLSTTFFGLNACIVAPNGRGGRCVTQDQRATGFIWADNKQSTMSAEAARCLPGWTQTVTAPENTNYRETVFVSPDGRMKFGVNYSYSEPVATLTAFATMPDVVAIPVVPGPPVRNRLPAPSCAALEEMLIPVRANFRNSQIAASGTPFMTPPVAGAENCLPIRRTQSNYAAALSCTWRIDAPNDADARATYAQWTAALRSCKSQLAPQPPKSGGSTAQMDEATLGEQFAPERWSISLHHDNPYRIMIMGFVRDVPP